MDVHKLPKHRHRPGAQPCSLRCKRAGISPSLRAVSCAGCSWRAQGTTALGDRGREGWKEGRGREEGTRGGEQEICLSRRLDNSESLQNIPSARDLIRYLSQIFPNWNDTYILQECCCIPQYVGCLNGAIVHTSADTVCNNNGKISVKTGGCKQA